MIDPAPSTNKRGAFRRKVQEIIDVVNVLDPDSGGPSTLKTVVVDGAAADTNIPIAGIAVADEIQSVIHYDTGVPADITAEVSITSAGNIQVDTTVTTGNKLVVTYYDVA
jgi:hypothetical protein